MHDASTAQFPVCPACAGNDVERLVSQVALNRRLSPGVGRAAYPTSWDQTNGGDHDTINYWKRRVEHEMNQESRDPGLRVERAQTADQRWDTFNRRNEPNVASTDVRSAKVPGDHDHSHSHPHEHGPEGHGPSHEAPAPVSKASETTPAKSRT